jgi:hypothetical protein
MSEPDTVGAAGGGQGARARSAAESLPPELERRLVAIEAGGEAGSDFDAVSWVWMILFGVVLPIVLLIWGWVGRAR